MNQNLYAYSKNKFTITLLFIFIGACLKTVLLHSFVLEKAAISEWVPIFVMTVIYVCQFIFFRLTYQELFFTTHQVKVATLSRKDTLFWVFFLDYIVQTGLNLLLIRELFVFKLACKSLCVALPILLYWYLLIVIDLKKVKKSIGIIIANYAVFFALIYATTSLTRMSMTILGMIYIVSFIWLYLELKHANA